MGASKALAECAVEAAQQRWPRTRYATVRFGNVLGSSGSVVPIFRRQIALGGPVTVTDERMTRYFMTIPEAVQLIIRVGLAGRGRRGLRARDGRAGVDHAARARHDRAVRACDPDRDIAIEVVGRRPGEKLHEELFNPYERPQPTPAEKILRAEREPLDPDGASRHRSTRSACWCSRATPPGWPRRSPSCPRAARTRPAPPAAGRHAGRRRPVH